MYNVVQVTAYTVSIRYVDRTTADLSPSWDVDISDYWTCIRVPCRGHVTGRWQKHHSSRTPPRCGI